MRSSSCAKPLGLTFKNVTPPFYLQQEELIDAARLDLKATFDAKIRDYHAKETTATKAARKASNATPKS